MPSSNVRKTADDNQATLQKEPGTAGNANDAALGVTPKDRITEAKSYSEDRQINSKKEAEDGDGHKGLEDYDSDSESDAEEAGDDGPPTWSGYGARAKVKNTVCGPKRPPPSPRKPVNEQPASSNDKPSS